MRAGASHISVSRGRALLCAACSLLLAFSPAARAQAPAVPLHRLSSGDTLEVQLYDGLERQAYTVQIDELGQITLPLLHNVDVAGLTSREAADLLRGEYLTYYVNPAVNITVRAQGQLRVFVFGPDINGRVVTLNTGASLLDLLERDELNPSMMNSARLNRMGAVTAEPPAEGAAAPAATVATDESATPEVLYTRGSYRRLHLVRGAGHFETLAADHLSQMAPNGGGQTDGGARPLDLAQGNAVSIDAPAGAGGAGHAPGAGLPSAMNWRRWIAERQQDEDSQLWVIDPLRITLEGELSRYNLLLRDGDVLYVPVPERFVDIRGVSKPGRYELLEEETLGDLLRMAGSVEYAYNLRNAVVQRYSSDGRLSRIVTNIYPGLDDIARIEAFPLENRDRIGIFPTEARVFVLGEVNTAGAFAYGENSTVLDYLALAGGETERAHLAWIAVIRQNRDRLDSGAAPDVLRLNFKEVHAGYPGCPEVIPLPGDIIYIPPKGYQFEMAPILQAIGTVVSGYALVDRAQND